MMFLLKAAFWLGLVLVLLPTGSNKRAVDAPQIDVVQAATAATAAVADLSEFCTRRPESCAVGSTVASVLAHRAQAGAVMVYEFITERREAASDKPEVSDKPDVVPVRHSITTEARSADWTNTTGSIRPGANAITLLPRPRPMLSYETLTAADRHPVWRQPDLRQEAQLRHPSN
jgi:hypothetical protein